MDMSIKLLQFSFIVLFLLVNLTEAHSQNQTELAIDGPRQNLPKTSNTNVNNENGKIANLTAPNIEENGDSRGSSWEEEGIHRWRNRERLSSVSDERPAYSRSDSSNSDGDEWGDCDEYEIGFDVDAREIALVNGTTQWMTAAQSEDTDVALPSPQQSPLESQPNPTNEIGPKSPKVDGLQLFGIGKNNNKDNGASPPPRQLDAGGWNGRGGRRHDGRGRHRRRQRCRWGSCSASCGGFGRRVVVCQRHGDRICRRTICNRRPCTFPRPSCAPGLRLARNRWSRRLLCIRWDDEFVDDRRPFSAALGTKALITAVNGSDNANANDAGGRKNDNIN